MSRWISSRGSRRGDGWIAGACPLPAWFLAMIFAVAGCTLAPTVNVPTEDIKESAKELSTGVKTGAKEFGVGLVAGSERYRDEIRAMSEAVTRVSQSTEQMVEVARQSPAAFGDALTKQLLQDSNIQATLKSMTSLARSGEQAVQAAEKGPDLLAGKITDLQTELLKPDGFVTQQREAILAEIKKERAAVTDALSREREAAMKDLDAYTIKVIHEASAQLRTLIGSAVAGIVVLLLVIWGVPFGAGYMVGRLSRKKP